MYLREKFLPQSSEIDWCESNYVISNEVAEFWNTISNAVFFVVPLLLNHLFKQYKYQVCRHVNIVWLLLVFVGVGSTYFHATLSLFGQLLDELAILYVCLASFAIFMPSFYLPFSLVGKNRWKYHSFLFMFGTVATVLSFIRPEYNHIFLFSFVFPGFLFLLKEVRNSDYDEIKHVGKVSSCLFILGLICWILDRNYCKSINFEYLHGFWHILVCIGSSMACVCYAYFYAIYEFPELIPRIKYWPAENSLIRVPYVFLAEIPEKQGKYNNF